MAEYDALPGVGHGCGHNLIAAAGVGASYLLSRLLEAHGVKGTVTILGTPGEEGTGGKVIMIRNGALKGVDAAMMCHPNDRSEPDTGNSSVERVGVTFRGKSVHVAGPEEGLNAHDAVNLLYSGISVWRQQLPESSRVHGVITHGGLKPNIIPESTSCEFYVRSPNDRYLKSMVKRFRDIVKGAALMTGTKSKIDTYSEEENEWRTIPERFKWPLKNAFGHIYSDNAHDSARSIYYHHVFGSNLVYGYDLAKKTWTQLPPGPFRGKMATSLEYFPELGGVVRHAEKTVHFYDEKKKKKSWSSLGKTQGSGFHALARYNPVTKEALLAGGGNAIVEKIDAKGKIIRLDDCPSKLSVRFDKLTLDPVSGRYLIFSSADKKQYELDSEKNEYRLVAEGKDKPVVHSWAVGAPIPEYGVVMFAATQITKSVKLYKHKVTRRSR